MELDLTALQEQSVNTAVVAEATAYKTVRTGLYRAVASKVEGRVMEAESKEGKPMPWPGRAMAHLTLALEDTDGNKKGSQFVDISWEVWRDIPNSQPFAQVKETDENRDEIKSYPVDKMTRFWGQVVKALGLENPTMGQVFNGVKEQMIQVYVNELFKNPETGKYQGYKTEDERQKMVEAGWEAKNFVGSFSKLK